MQRLMPGSFDDEGLPRAKAAEFAIFRRFSEAYAGSPPRTDFKYGPIWPAIRRAPNSLVPSYSARGGNSEFRRFLSRLRLIWERR